METFYKILLTPTKTNLHLHDIKYFDTIFATYPADAEKIIGFINDCYCYKSPWLVDGKDWKVLLEERYKKNGISASLKESLLSNKIAEITNAIWCYINHQKQDFFATKVAKENLRLEAFSVLSNPDKLLGEKKMANELLSSLDAELEALNEKLIQDNQVFGKGAGYDVVKKAKTVTQLSIVNI